MVGIAQLARASGCGPEGCGFEPRYSPQFAMKTNLDAGCSGCGKPIPEVGVVNGLATWFGSYDGQKMTSFVCVECWHRGIRHEKVVIAQQCSDISTN